MRIIRKKNLQKGLPIPSYTILDNSELNSLVLQKAGKGYLTTDKIGNWKNKEVTDFGKVIGQVYTDGKFIATRWGKVHYSKTGSHVIPRLEEDKQ
ncbi:polymorphic toxin type 50 domain-containing protein [Staphylococcus pseudintermedius]|nr:polymorphic toxin type 50 domain-containing protein [Staphylococcus pseudintermedius]